MGFFNFLNKKSDNESAATVSLPVVEPSEAKEEVESVAPGQVLNRSAKI